MQEYAARFPQIKGIRNEHQLGINENFFSVMKKATCDYIAVSDQDDIWEPDKLESQINAIGNQLLCSGRTVPFSEGGAAISIDERTPCFSLYRMCYIGCLAGHTFLFPQRLLQLAAPVLQAPRTWDSILSLVAGSYDSIVFVDRKIVNQRRHVKAATYTKPLNYKFSLGNIFGTSLYAFSLYRELKPQMRKKALDALDFLSRIDSKEPVLTEAKRMMTLQADDSLLSFIKLSLFCFKHQTELYYAQTTKRSFALSIRALLFPIYSSLYLRYLSKRYKK